MSEHDELKKLLRKNSSDEGQSVEAAAVIEELENQVGNYEELVSQLEAVIVFPETDDRGWQYEKLKEILGLTHKVIYQKRMASGDPENG